MKMFIPGIALILSFLLLMFLLSPISLFTKLFLLFLLGTIIYLVLAEVLDL